MAAATGGVHASNETTRVLQLSEYRALVALDVRFPTAAPIAEAERPELIRGIVQHLTWDGTAARLGVTSSDVPEPSDVHGFRRLLRALLTVRDPEPLPPGIHAALDRLLQAERADRGETEAVTLPRLEKSQVMSGHEMGTSAALWCGDITTLRADAIVNAANAALLGCFRPFHACIDNAIHSAAGPRLREDCGRIMDSQARPEPTGTAKATRGYNLPAKYVLHTVGPTVRGELRAEHEDALARCYRACLDLATELPEVRSVAFCAISTGVYGFPKVPAARIATRAVAEWQLSNPGALDVVVFNVFSEDDLNVYEKVLGGGE